MGEEGSEAVNNDVGISGRAASATWADAAVADESKDTSSFDVSEAVNAGVGIRGDVPVGVDTSVAAASAADTSKDVGGAEGANRTTASYYEDDFEDDPDDLEADGSGLPGASGASGTFES